MSLLNKIPKSNRQSWPWNEETDITKYNEYEQWPKISIVTPSYNQGEFIEETIRSIVLQNYPNIEYIIMDGGSNDSTLEVIERYKDQINYFVSEKDNGQSDAIARGFERSSGVILNWINSDDILCKDALYHVAKAFIENPKSSFVHGKNGIMNKSSELYNFMPHPKDNLKLRYLYEMPYGQQGVFFKKSLYLKAGGINKDIKFSMDFELYVKMHLMTSDPVQIDDQLGNIRIHESTKTSNLEDTMHFENGNTVLSLFETFGEKSKVKFLKSIGHRSYGKYNTDLNLNKSELNQIFVSYLKKNIWYYYNKKNFEISKKMATEIVFKEPVNIFNMDYIKIIKDGIVKK